MREITKQFFRLIAVVAVAPILLLDLLLRPTGSDAVFAGCTQFMSLAPGRIGSYLRIAYLRFAAKACSPDSFIGFGSVFSQRDISIGRRVYIGPQCNIGKCAIGDDTLAASGVHIMSGTRQHRFDDLDTPIRDQGGSYEDVTIGRDCWIGNGALVMANIGDHCVVGAGSVVTEELPDFSVAVGNPARVVRSRKPKAKTPSGSTET